METFIPTLWSFSNEIGAARARSELYPSLSDWINKLFHCEHFVVTVDDPRQNRSFHFLSSSADIVLDQHPARSAPMFAANRSIGTLYILTEQQALPDIVDLDLLQAVANQLAFAVLTIQSNEKIEEQALEISALKQRLTAEHIYLQEEFRATHNYGELVGVSRPMNEVFYLVSQVAETQSTVLILGETGTGKELIARAIHNASPRKGKLMVKVNCATLPANLIESELFGHERGSFTGALERRIGKFELAIGSTLFLDEIGELPLELQVKLLRALQEREIERLGGRSVIKTDVRVIAATNRNLQKEVEQGTFRSDLFFRLNVFPITIPPLRDRKDDIPRLALHFLEKYKKKTGRKITGFSNKAIKELMNFDWPGNVRELEHLVERAVLLTQEETVSQWHLHHTGRSTKKQTPVNGPHKTIEQNERDHIMSVLNACRGKVGGAGGAAEILGIPATTLHSKMKRLAIGKKYSGA